MKVRIILKTLLARCIMLFLILMYFIPFCLLMLVPRRWRYECKLYYLLVYSFYFLLCKALWVPISIRGKEHLPKEPAIFVANHQSSLDIPLLGSLLRGHPHVWLAKKFLMESPILRFVLPGIAILVDVSTPITALRTLIGALNIVGKKRHHIMIFPEGGRFVDGKIHDFYAGFAILAKRTGNPIIPIRMFNVGKVYPPQSFWIYDFPITIVIGESMNLQEGESEESFKKRVYQWFVNQEE